MKYVSTFLSLLIGKAILIMIKLSNKGSGSALPGLVIEKINPNLFKNQITKLKKGVIIVTGTNGKTTTSRAISGLLSDQGLKVLNNETGSNFTRGLLSLIIQKSNPLGGLNYDIAVLEVDEAYVGEIAKITNPRLLVILNVFRDQLDRYGELDQTVQKIISGARFSDRVLINGAEGVFRKLENFDSYIKFGFSAKLNGLFPDDASLYAGKKDHMSSQLDYELKEIKTLKGDYQQKIIISRMIRKKNDFQVNLRLGGNYNSLNATAAFAACDLITNHQSPLVLVDSLSKITAPFGRGENFYLNNKLLTLNLIKNPSGFNHIVSSLQPSKNVLYGFVINDDYADGQDVSWLWDCDVSIFSANNVDIITSGNRGHDMKLRLIYQNIKVKNTTLNIEELYNKIKTVEHAEIQLFATYTSMLKLRKLFTQNSSLTGVK